MTAAARKAAYEMVKLLPQFIKDLNRLQPEYASADRIWRLPTRIGSKPTDWATIHARHYEETYYLSWTASELSLELDSKGKARSPIWPVRS
jgi:hypothetical protein